VIYGVCSHGTLPFNEYLHPFHLAGSLGRPLHPPHFGGDKGFSFRYMTAFQLLLTLASRNVGEASGETLVSNGG